LPREPINRLGATDEICETASAYDLKVGLIWFVIAFSLTRVYTIVVYRASWGKVRLDLEASPAE